MSGENTEVPKTPVIDRRYSNMDWKNKLYFGDNLKILRDYVPDGSVNLIYPDPPFNSSATYNVLLKEDVAQGPLSGPAAFQDKPTVNPKPGLTVATS